ncbi:hypothetical protein [Ilumatobacter sp.]|uniref:hypothetical protein n=1 Tax=Ilumatobacter sp. TaxID=1967498 RepID=UPI0037505DB1
MNELKDFSRLRPNDEQLDPATNERVWNLIAEENNAPATSRLTSTSDDLGVQLQLVDRSDRTEPQLRRRVAVLGAAAAIVVGMAGFAVVSNNRATPSSTASQPSEIPVSAANEPLPGPLTSAAPEQSDPATASTPPTIDGPVEQQVEPGEPSVGEQINYRIGNLTGEGPLGALGYVITSADVQPDSSTTITVGSTVDGRSIEIRMGSGDPLQPEDHDRVPITILDSTELSIHGQLDSNSGWTFEIVAERSSADGDLPTSDQLQDILYSLDP